MSVFRLPNREQLSTLDVLQKYIDVDLSQGQHEIIRTKWSHKDKMGHCYPKPEAFYVTDRCAEVNLQNLLDHTATRLVKYLEDVLPRLEENQRELELISKWGCDGSQQVEYKQKFGNENNSNTQIFQTSMLPLRLICGKKNYMAKSVSVITSLLPPNQNIKYFKKKLHILLEIKWIIYKKQIDKLINTQIDGNKVQCLLNTH